MISIPDTLSTSQVFTTTLLHGISVDKCFDMDLEIRKDVARKMMKLVILELFEFQYMQTDPNWANFLYNPTTKQVCKQHTRTHSHTHIYLC